MGNFIMLKNELVQSEMENIDKDIKKRVKDSLIVKYGNNKMIGVLCALDQAITKNNYCKFTIDELCGYCGVKTTKGKGKSIEQIRVILIALQSEGYILNINVDLLNVKATEMIKCTYLNGISEDFKNGFFKLPIDIYIKLLELKDTDALMLYCNIKSKIGENNYYNFTQITTFATDINVDKNTIERLLSVLEDNKLVFKVSIGQVRKDGITSNYKNYYVLNENEIEKVKEQAMLDATGEGYHILTKFQDKKIKQLNGLKGQRQKQANAGKDTSKLDDKIAQLEEKYSYKFDGETRKDILAKIDELRIKYNLDVNAYDIANNSDYKIDIKTKEGCAEVLAIIEESIEKNDFSWLRDDEEESNTSISEEIDDTKIGHVEIPIWGEPYKEIEDNKVIPMPKERIIKPKKTIKSIDFEKKQQNITDLKMTQWWEARNIQGLIENYILKYNDCVSSNKKINMNSYVDNFKKITSINELEEKLKEFIKIVNNKEQEYKEEMEDLEALL